MKNLICFLFNLFKKGNKKGEIRVIQRITKEKMFIWVKEPPLERGESV